MEALLPTTRLKFVEINNEIKKAISSDIKAFSKEYGLLIPEGWPLVPEAFKAFEDDADDETIFPWCSYLFLNFEGTKIIGNGGFISAPKNSEVEIGFEIAPEYQNIGYATEAATEMLSFALINGAKSVIAHTLAKENASVSVLKNIGMKYVKDVPNEELGKVWLWQIAVK